MPGPGPNPPWQKTVVDNGAEYWLNEQEANEAPVTVRFLFVKAADGTKVKINLADGTTWNWD